MKWAVFLLAASVLMSAADLEAIRATQTKLIAARGKNQDVRGANPDLTVLKHQLRDWAESQIVHSGPFPEVTTLSATLNALFDQKKIIEPEPDDDWPGLGAVAPFEVSHPDGDSAWLKLEIGVAIDCGYDESVYLYEWTGKDWARSFESEQNDYTKDHFTPQDLRHVEVSPSDANGDRLILTIGITPSCASVWQGLYYRLFRVGATTTRLVDDFTEVNIGEEIQARIEPEGALIEFFAGSRDSDQVWARTHVLHLRVDGAKARRVEPVALTAQDFVDEWLSQPWKEISEWTDPKLTDVHAELKKAEVDGGFQLVQRCTEHSDQWQVGFDFKDDTYYFLVQQKGEYGFRMLDVSDERQPGCPGDDPPRNLGNQSTYPTMFPAAKKP
jgi:hypothetical protein